MAPSEDPDWDATLARAVARAEAADAEERQLAQRSDHRRAEREQVRSAAAQELSDSGVPAVILDQLRANRILETMAIAKVRQWRRTRSWVLILSGGYGIGKDHAFAWHMWLDALAKAEARRGSHVKVAKCWFNAATIQSIGNYDRAEFERLASVPLLVIPDLGGEHHNGAWLSLLGNLLDERFGNHKRTLISTNLPRKPDEAKGEKVSQLRTWMGDRIASRINAGGVISGVDGPDIRQLGFFGQHGLPLVGPEVTRPHHETEEREARFVVRPDAYRIRMPKARAVRNRNQLNFLFA